jgi:hypothetical protein
VQGGYRHKASRRGKPFSAQQYLLDLYGQK